MLYRSLELPHSIEAAALGQTPPAAAAPAAPAAAAANETSWLDGLVGPQQIALLEHIGIALGLFVAGWLLAKLASWATYRLLTRADIGKRAATRLGMGKLARGEGDADANKAERVLAKAVYFVLMLLVVVGVLQYAGLTQVAAPIQTLVERVVDALVFLGKAALILAVAYLVAVALEKAVAKLLGGVGLDARFAELSRTDDAEEAEDGAPERPFSEHVGRVLFWLVMIVGLAGALEALNITPISVPLGNAIDKVVGILPSLGVAALLVLAGYVLGKIAAAVVRNILQSAGFDDLVQRLRLDRIFGKTPPSRVVGLFVMIFIILEAVIAALDEVGLDTLSGPLARLVERFWALLPALAVAAIIIAAGFLLGRVAHRVVSGALANLGFDGLMSRLGLGGAGADADKRYLPSAVVGLVAQIVVVLLALGEGLEQLGLQTWAEAIAALLAYGVRHVLVAAVILVAGLALGAYVEKLVLSRASSTAERGSLAWVATVSRYLVLVFAFTMAVAQLDVASEFVLLSFALLFGSLCLALAIAIGLGGREVAGELVRGQYERARAKLSSTPEKSEAPLSEEAAPEEVGELE